ncbi:MAG: GGDEF domain-containing protein [Roseibium sp.]
MRSGFNALTRGFRRRLTFIFGAVICCFAITATGINFLSQQRLAEEGLAARADQLGRLVSEVTGSYVYDMRFKQLEILYQEVQRREDISFVHFLDEDGTLLVSGDISQPELVLEPMPDLLVDLTRRTQKPQSRQTQDMAEYAYPILLNNEYLGILRFGIKLDRLQASISQIVWGNLLLGLFFAGLGILVSFLFSEQLTRPLRILVSSVDRAAKGDLDQKLSLKTNDEFESLSSSIGTMLGSLRANINEIHTLAYFDTLTGLRNRTWFMTHLANMLQFAEGADKKAAVLFLDIDNFKDINDSKGHHAGDQFLKHFAGRLDDCVKASWQNNFNNLPPEKFQESGPAVCRLGGDEFTILVTDLVETEVVSGFASDVLQMLEKPFLVEEYEFLASCSIGIALVPQDGETAVDILKAADAAMYQAKNSGRATYCYYDEEQANAAIRRIELARDLRLGLEADEMEVYFQPILSVDNSEIVGAEALARWDHPEKGMLAPDEFLDVASESNLMHDISKVVFRKALKQAKLWNNAGRGDIRLCVNISLFDLAEIGFSVWLLKEIKETGLSPSLLELEINERTAMNQTDVVEAQILRLKSVGIRFAIDDFGIGYSNLARLKQLAFDCLKIDRSLVQGIGEDEEAERLLVSLLSMADGLELDTVLEGIETDRQLNFIQTTGANSVQGYALAHPMNGADFYNWIFRRDQNNYAGKILNENSPSG